MFTKSYAPQCNIFTKLSCLKFKKKTRQSLIDIKYGISIKRIVSLKDKDNFEGLETLFLEKMYQFLSVTLSDVKVT